MKARVGGRDYNKGSPSKKATVKKSFGKSEETKPAAIGAKSRAKADGAKMEFSISMRRVSSFDFLFSYNLCV